MIKIGLVLTPVEFGGAERVCLNLLKRINREMFNVVPIVLVRPWEHKNLFQKELENEMYEYLTIPVALYEKHVKKDWFRVIRCFKLIWTIMRDQSFDIIHTNGYFADIIGIPAARMMGIPSISTCHGFITNDMKLKLYCFLDRMVLLFANKIIAVSDDIKDNLAKIGIKKSKIRVILNSVESNSDRSALKFSRMQIPSNLDLQDEDLVLGYVGRLSEEKGTKFLIEAVSSLDQAKVPVKLLLIGDGHQKRELERLVQEKGLNRKVLFVGFQDRIEVWLKMLDVFVLPSLSEGTPMALLEAMAQGLPVVASNVGGIPSIIRSGYNGILTEPANQRKLVDAISMIYQNSQFRASLGVSAKKTVRERFNAAIWVKEIESLYLSIQRRG